MGYKEIQKKFRKRSKMGRMFKSGNKPHVIDRDGLYGSELEVLDAMFTKGKKAPLKFERLTSLQKKVLRKMKYEKSWFLVGN